MAGKRKGLADHVPATAQERRFAEEYLADLDPVAAALRAGYERSVAQDAVRWVKPGQEPQIQSEIARLRTARSIRTEITMDRVVLELGRVAFYDPLDYFEVAEDGSMVVKRLDEIPEDARRAVEAIEMTAGGAVRLKFASKLDAIKALTPHVEHMDPARSKGRSRGEQERLADLLDLMRRAAGRELGPKQSSRVLAETTSANGDRTVVQIRIDSGDDPMPLPEKDVTP